MNIDNIVLNSISRNILELECFSLEDIKQDIERLEFELERLTEESMISGPNYHIDMHMEGQIDQINEAIAILNKACEDYE